MHREVLVIRIDLSGKTRLVGGRMFHVSCIFLWIEVAVGFFFFFFCISILLFVREFGGRCGLCEFLA